jgi:hypothetical protein
MTVAASTTNTAEQQHAPDAEMASKEPPIKPAPDIADNLEPSVYRFILRHSL